MKIHSFSNALSRSINCMRRLSRPIDINHKKNPVEGVNLQTGTTANSNCRCNLKSFFDYVIVPSSAEVVYDY